MASRSGSGSECLLFGTDPEAWTSPGGIVYLAESAEGHWIMHVLAHTVPGYNGKTLHSVFSVARHQLFGLLDEAWLGKVGPGTLQANGNRYWIVDMGRQVGTSGQTSIKIIVEDGTSSIITAFPQ
ncbi:MAG: hypothetical protein V4584_08625 [Verrucomicrobiota bacterium]